jgi:uncharacterized protein YegP (UPF0339 family)
MNLNICSARSLFACALLSLSVAACGAAPEEVETYADESAELGSTSAYFETFEGEDGQVYFHLVAGNGELVLKSEGYTRAQNANKAINSVVANAQLASSFDVLEASDGSFYFNVVAQNGETIATSQTYANKSNATRGVKTVQRLLGLTGQPAKVKAAPEREQFELFQGENGKFYFQLRAGNGEVMLSSEAYTRKANAEKGIASVIANADLSAFEPKEIADGRWIIDMDASNGETIAWSEAYSTKSNATRAIKRLVEMLKDGAPVAK